ncbi:MAG: ABC transporter substrate-binding protein [Acidobacteriota bacterium]
MLRGKCYQIIARLAAVGAGLAMLAGGACSSDRTRPSRIPEDGSVTVAIESAPAELDPRIGADQASGRAHELLYDGLVEWDMHAQLVPALAERWEVLDDGLRWRFHLRPGVRFHDGRALTSADVVWTLQSVLDGSVTTSKRGALQAVHSAVAVDPLTVDLVLTEPFSALLAELTSGFGIVPAGTTPAMTNRSPIGTGPFRYAARSADALELLANPEAFRGKPQISRLVLKGVPDTTVRALELLKGSAQLVVNDLAPDAIPAFAADPRFRVAEQPGASFVYLGLNFHDPLLAKRQVRQAIERAIDREQIVRTLWRDTGIVSETIFPPGHWARDETLAPVPFDPAGAKHLLDAAGFPDPDGDGPRPRFRLVYKTSTAEMSQLQAQAVQAMLGAVGIEVEIRTAEFAALYEDIRRANFQLFSLTRTAVLEPNVFRLMLHSKSLPPNGQNRGGYANAEFDAAIEAAGRTTDQEARRILYTKAQEIFADDLPYILLLVKKNVAVMPRELEGYANYPNAAFTVLRDLRWSR